MFHYHFVNTHIWHIFLATIQHINKGSFKRFTNIKSSWSIVLNTILSLLLYVAFLQEVVVADA